MVVGNGVVENDAVLMKSLLNLLLSPRSDRLVVATHTRDSEVVHTAREMIAIVTEIGKHFGRTVVVLRKRLTRFHL